jgi:predicted  nucleic acid-binding Zn-ribbon protein
VEELRSLTDLLDLHEVDRTIDRLIDERQHLPALDEYRGADAELRRLTGERDAAADRLKVAQRGLDKTSGELELAKAKADTEEMRLYAGGLSARDADFLRQEVEMLRNRVSSMEDEALELMETVEREEAESQRLDAEVGAAEMAKDGLEASIKSEWARIDSAIAAKEAAKADLVPLVDESILDLYEDLRATRKDQPVVGALVDGVCGACHLKLSAAEEHDARLEDPPRCVHCRAILVP